MTFARTLLVAVLAASVGATSAIGQPVSTEATLLPPPLSGADRESIAAIERAVSALEQRVLVADDANARWIAAQLARSDPPSAATQLKAAFEREPRNLLFLSSLAFACARPTLPILPECAATDYVAQWSFRDEGNAVPALLLAERSRRRGDIPTMTAQLERAAGGPRYDDYWGRAVGAFAVGIGATAAIADPALAAVTTLTLATANNNHGIIEFELVCASRSIASDVHKAACARLSALMAQRATSLIVRGVGARGEAAFATSDAQRDAANTDRAAFARLEQDCGSALKMQALMASDAAARRVAVADFTRWLVPAVRDGEVAACMSVRNG